MRLCIYCAGGNGKTGSDLAEIVNDREQRWEEIIFVDDILKEKRFYSKRVFSLQELEKEYEKETLEFVISIGEPMYRESIYQRVKKAGYSFTTLIHPEANISKTAVIQEGVSISRATVTSDVYIGENTHISEFAVIGHDTIVGKHSVISAHSFIGGHCVIKDRVYIGPAAAIRDRITIGEDCVVAMAAGVYREIPDHMIALGNPSKNMKKDPKKTIF